MFQERRQYCVPFYQRAYVWNKNEQWEPLWNDIKEKAEARLLGDGISPHFLGAIVLEPQDREGLIGVEQFHIIDGQQRLTTLQYFLAALKIVLRTMEERVLLSVVENCLRNGNPESMKNPEIELYKVWPTFRDRSNFLGTMEATDIDALKARFPSSFTKSGGLRQIGCVHPPALEAIYYFHEQILAWVKQLGDGTKAKKIAAIAEAVLRDFKFVCIFLGKDDDAQIIFETLNGRGAELNATDLIRNFIFMRADHDNAPSLTLYDTLWSQFEKSFWSEEQRRGRLRRPRLEWFVQTAIEAELCSEVDIGRLYVGYRRYALGQNTPVSASDQLQMLSSYAEPYRQLVTGMGDTPIAKFGRRITLWDASTTHSLALFIAKSAESIEEQRDLFDILVSYLVRRAVCGLTAKNYNKVFMNQLARMAGKRLTANLLAAGLASLDGNASRWPNDDEFRKSWLESALYGSVLDSAKLKAILVELENGLRSPRSEEPLASGLERLDVDHILPDSWFENWPLPDHSKATSMEAYEARYASYGDRPVPERVLAIRKRESAKHRIGNLTLIHYGVNRSLQHCEFPKKREVFFKESNLHLNRTIMGAETWDESAIDMRARDLLSVAVKIWRGPDAYLTAVDDN
jgi:hypothetical protein